MEVSRIVKRYARRNDVGRADVVCSSKYAETSPRIPASVAVTDEKYDTSRLTEEAHRWHRQLKSYSRAQYHPLMVGPRDCYTKSHNQVVRALTDIPN